MNDTLGREFAKMVVLPLVEEYKEKLAKLSADQGAKLVLGKGDDVKDLRKTLKVAAGARNRRVRLPFRGEEGSLSFYLVRTRGRKAEEGADIGVYEIRREAALIEAPLMDAA
jgi:hypothetical protein